jgi:type II secretory pathway component PulF
MNEDGVIAILCVCAALFAGFELWVVFYPRTWRFSPRRIWRPRISLRAIGWVMAILGYMAAAVLFFGPLGIVLWIVALIVLIEVTTRKMRTQQRALLGALAVSAERSISLIPTLEAFARETGGRLARRAHRLAEMLVGGMPLPEALDATHRLLPRAALPLIHVGYQSNALMPALRRAADTQQLPQPVWEAVMGRLMYLCWVLFMGAALLGFMVMKIVPQFIKIFKDFGADLPPMTQAVVNVVRWLSPLGLIGGLLPLLVGAVGLYAMLRFTGLIQWDLPGVGWLLRRLDTALIFESLALAAEHRQPLPQAIECLAWTYPKEAIRVRLDRALNEISAGRNWCECLRAHGLIRQADLAVLQAAERVGNLPWALREMADSNRRRLAYRLHTLVQLLFPLVILVLGLAVCCVAVGFILPLLSLTYKLV